MLKALKLKNEMLEEKSTRKINCAARLEPLKRKSKGTQY